VPSRTGLRSKSRNTPFLDTEIQGRVLMTLADGKVIFESAH
jgi:dihydroorotase-like cyclic amidohydrolase